MLPAGLLPTSMLRGLWAYRSFIGASIRSEIKGRYARSRLGAAWLVLNPLAFAAVLALALAEVLAARIPGAGTKGAYAIYLLAGIASWNLFSEIVNRSTTIFVDYASVLKKIAFPRLCLPVIIAGGALVNHALLLLAIAIVCVLLGHAPGVNWLFLPIGVALIAAFGFGLGILLGVVNTFARDVGQVTGIVLQFWFWLTPIVYTAESLPERLRWISALNPFAPLAGLYQNAILFNRAPDWASLATVAVLATLMMVVSLMVFRRASPELVDAL